VAEAGVPGRTTLFAGEQIQGRGLGPAWVVLGWSQ
jgi:hypothetical protein